MAWKLHIPYLLDQMPWLLLISPRDLVRFLFESGHYSRVTFIINLKRNSHASYRWTGGNRLFRRYRRRQRWVRREQTSSRRLLVHVRCQSLLVLWLITYYCMMLCTRCVHVYARATRILAAATIWEWWVLPTAHLEVKLLFESCVWLSEYGM